MRIGEPAEATGVSARSLRYHEEQGLLLAHRTAAGHRRYTPGDVERVVAIQQLHAAGLDPHTGLGAHHEPMEPQQQHRPVSQLRVVVEAHDYEMALAFFRDALGLPESASFAEGPEDRVSILEAGRVTVEITSTAHQQVIDRIEADGRPSSGIRRGCRSPSSRNCSPQENEPPCPGSSPGPDSQHSSSEAA